MIKNFVVIFFVSLFIVSCTPQEVTNSGQCGENQTFDDVKRTCVVDESPRLPVAQTTQIDLLENQNEESFPILYTDYDGDEAISCTITSSTSGLRGYLNSQGITYKTLVTDQSDLTYSLSLIHDSAVVPGSEYLDLSSLPHIKVYINSGTTASQQVANVINNDSVLSNHIQATVTNMFNFQVEAIGSNFQAGLCDCVNGSCSYTVEPATDFDGVARVEYFLTDSDGNSNIKTLSVVVANDDQAPVSSDNNYYTIASQEASEDTSFSVLLDYTDIDLDIATLCSANSTHPNITLGSCSCVAGVCSVLVTPDVNYATKQVGTNPDPNGVEGDIIEAFEFSVTANNKVSNISKAYVTILEVNDGPSVAAQSSENSGAVPFEINEEGDVLAFSASYTFNLPVASDIESDSTNLTYDDTNLGSFTQFSITGCLDGTSSRTCTLTPIDNDYFTDPSSIGITYQVTDDGGATSSVQTFYLKIISNNDYPVFSPSTTVNVTGNESVGFTPIPVTFDLDDTDSNTVSDGSDSETTSGNLKYHLSDVSGNILTSGSGANGTLSSCLNLDGSGTSDLECVYTPTSGDSTGLVDTFYYLMEDEDSGFSTPRQIDITLNDQSDIPVVCQYSKYSTQRTECGVLGCIGEGSPVFLPTSHSDDDPVVYYDKTNGDCYTSASVNTWNSLLCNYTTGTLTECSGDDCIGNGAPSLTPTSHSDSNPVVFYDQSNGVCYQSVDNASGLGWEEVSYSYVKDIVAGEKENIVISDIVINEGGDSSEDGEDPYVDLSTLSISDTVLIKPENVTFEYYDQEGSLESSFKGDTTPVQQSVSTEANSTDVSLGRMKITIVPTAGQSGLSQISFDVIDDSSTLKKTKVTFNVEVKAQEVVHKGWTKILARGIKTNKFNRAIEVNDTCTYSMDKCDNGQACYSTTSGAPTASADYTGAIYKTATGCYYSTRAGSHSDVWQEMTDNFCNITEVKRSDANSIGRCIYSSSSCTDSSTQSETLSCVSSQSGAPTLYAKSAGAIFRNGNGDCYESSAAGDNWTLISSYTGTLNDVEDSQTTCDNGENRASCIIRVNDVLGDNVDAGDVENHFAAADNVGAFLYNSTELDNENERCWYSDGTSWKQYSSTTEVTLAWNEFEVTGTGSISGYNIYRRRANEEFDYSVPINSSVVSASIREYVDNGTNSRFPPASNQVYYYEVRPIIVTSGEADLELSTNTSIKNVRLLSPADNMVFAHRWMLNKRVCSLITPGGDIEDEYNGVCEYIGLGDVDASFDYPTLSSASYIYDIGSDLLIQNNEMGCPYTHSGCNTNDGTCIDNRAPVDGDDGSAGDYFYNRSSGVCSYNNAGSWVNVSTQDLNDTTSQATGLASHLPPLTNINQSDSAALCSGLTKPSGIVGIVSNTPSNNFELPSRKDQVAYSQWEISTSLSDSEAEVLEEGLALNSASKCNSSNASGVTSAYVDTALPASPTFYSIPGTFSSNIRSVYTGSDLTRACVSHVGVQDSIGNVAEWTTDSFVYNSTNTSFDSSSFTLSDSGVFGAYNFDGLSGPCDDSDSSGDCTSGTDTEMMEWSIFDTTVYDSNRFNVALGLPISTNFEVDPLINAAAQFTLAIGPSSGITVSQLHSDSINPNMANLNDNDTAYIVSGGSYLSGTGAGTYSFETVEQSQASRADIGLRCLIRLYDSDFEP